MRLFGITVLISFSLAGQENDSLLNRLTHLENDTERVNQLYETGFDRRNSDPKRSYQFALVCQQEALKTNSPKHLAKSFNLLGVLSYKKGELNQALSFQKQALRLNESVHYTYGVAINYTNLGNIYSDAHYYKQAEIAYLKALHASHSINNTLQIARCLINLGVLKYTQKQYDSAIIHFKEALAYSVKVGDYELIASCDHNIGCVLTDQNALDSALVYLEEGLNMRSMIENEFELADSYLSIASIYLKQKNFNQVTNYLMLAESVCRQYDYAEAMVELYHTRSLLYEEQKNYEQAHAWLKKYDQLKDSIQTIHTEEEQLILLDETHYAVEPKKNSEIHNLWLMMVMGLFIIFIPLYLIRYKR